jgi:hypothetical protein
LPGAVLLDHPAPLKQPQPAGLIDEYTVFELEALETPVAHRIALALKLGNVVRVNLPYPTLEMIGSGTGVDPEGGAPK